MKVIYDMVLSLPMLLQMPCYCFTKSRRKFKSTQKNTVDALSTIMYTHTHTHARVHAKKIDELCRYFSFYNANAIEEGKQIANLSLN